MEIEDEKSKKKAMKAVSSISGVDSISVDMKGKKLTVLGDVDPVEVVGKLRKSWHADLVSVGPAKEPEKEKEKKEDQGKKEQDNKKNNNTASENDRQVAELVKLYRNNYNPYNTHMAQPHAVYSMEENPNSCVIC